MDLFQHRYYRTNKMLLTMIGQWPYQSSRVRYGFFSVLAFIATSISIPQMMAFVKYRDDWEFILESAPPFILELSLVVKVFFSIWNSQKVRSILANCKNNRNMLNLSIRKIMNLFNHFRADWRVWRREQEINIIHEYAEQGRKMTIMYTVMVLSTNILFTITPIAVRMIDVMLKNGSTPGEFPIPVHYYNFDMQKYYFCITMHCFVCSSVGAFVMIAIDSRLIIFVQHGCGLFAAVGHKLQRTGMKERSTNTDDVAYKSNTKDMDFEHIVSCIKGHNDAIEYTKVIETIYSWCFFFLVGCNMIIISFIGMQILNKANNPGQNTRFIVFLVANMAHLFMENYMSQILMDHSIDIRYSVHNGRWYRLSQPAQKLLILVIMRCNVPSQLTVAKISTLSIKTFTTILQASMTYFTFLRSV